MPDSSLLNFDFCYNLTEITVSDVSIGKYKNLFGSSKTIKKVIISDGIESIEAREFENCSSLQYVVLPESLTSIERYAFYCCSNLASITIPESVVTIEDQAFYSCTHLYEIYNLSDLNFTCGSTDYGYIAYYAKVIHNSTDDQSLYTNTPDGFSFMKEGDSYYLVSYIGSDTVIVLPDSFVMNGNTITKYGINDSVFKNYSILTCITIPESVKSIGDFAFYGCNHLYEIYNLSNLNLTCGSEEYGYIAYYAKAIHNSLDEHSVFYTTDDGFIFMVSDNYCALFSYIDSETSITLPDTIIIEDRTITEYEIFDSVFEGYSSLTSISIPQSVTSIGNSVFKRCVNLENISLPGTVTSIGNSAFEGCRSLKSLSIPQSVTSVGDSAFEGCVNLDNISLPDSVTSIGSSAFASCTKLERIVIPYGVKKINPNTFSGCSNLIDITIPESVTSIGKQAFIDCRSLESIVIPYGVRTINTKTFARCSNLCNITIPESVTSIGKQAFSDCIALSIITIPDSVEEIYGSAFYNCENLVIIKLPASRWEVYLNDEVQGSFEITAIIGAEGAGYSSIFVNLYANPAERYILRRVN